MMDVKYAEENGEGSVVLAGQEIQNEQMDESSMFYCCTNRCCYYFMAGIMVTLIIFMIVIAFLHLPN